MLRNKFKNFSLFFFLILVLLITGLPLVVIKAQAPPGGGGAIENPLGTESFTELVNRIATWVFNIGIALATVMFLWGALLFMTSGGSPERVAQAKRTMVWAAVGLVVCLCGAGITILIRNLLGAS